MIETYEYAGFWWLPSDDSQRLSGTLRIVRGRATLDLLGDFGREVIDQTETETTYAGMVASQPRILGLTTDGKAVTLEGCFAANSKMNFPGIPTTTYLPGVVLVDAWFGDGEAVEFDEIALRTTELDAWALVSGFSNSISTEELPTGNLT